MNVCVLSAVCVSVGVCVVLCLRVGMCVRVVSVYACVCLCAFVCFFRAAHRGLGELARIAADREAARLVVRRADQGHAGVRRRILSRRGERALKCRHLLPLRGCIGSAGQSTHMTRELLQFCVTYCV